MAVSDRHFSAQVRGGPPDARTELYKFDDLGCAVIWLDEQPWKADARTEMWVTDYRNGKWLDARKAFYVGGLITPMDYELGAIDIASEDSIDYESAVKHIYAIEARKVQR